MKNIVGASRGRTQKIKASEIFTTLSVYILAILLTIEFSVVSIKYQGINITLVYSILFVLRSTIAGTKSFLFDKKSSPTRTNFFVFLLFWIILISLLLIFIEPWIEFSLSDWFRSL